MGIVNQLNVYKTGFLLLLLSLSASAEDNLVFSRDVLPILSDHCFQCHGPDANEGRKGDLRLDDETDAKRDRDGVHVIKAGDPNASELIFRITDADADEQMPPPQLGRPLNQKQINTLTRWIEQGASWGKHWAFETVQPPDPGPVEQHPIDVFVERRLAAEKQPPHLNPPAERRALIRRLSLDLTGLPPTPQQTAAFLADQELGAWERLIDRTLAVPAYGERMAWDWLDAARYADTNGYQGDRERTMWPWRDWVIRAFNQNLPYDEFTVQQLAGDLLPNPTDDQILATAFNRNYMINGEGGRIAEENRVDYVFDMTETMGTVWLGLTLNCCRCHDHKFDPLTQREYFQFTAFFNQTPVSGGGGDPQTKPVIEVPQPSTEREIEELKAKIVDIDRDLATRRKALRAKRADWENSKHAKLNSPIWQTLIPKHVEADHQTLEVIDGSRVLAKGKNPDKDVYRLTFALPPGPLAAVQLDALRHPSMTHGGLARSNSGNFVLTHINFELESKNGTRKPLMIGSAEATFEQGDFKIANSFDGDKSRGWAVWNGEKIDRDHSGVYHFKERFDVKTDATLHAELRFESPHKVHNLGHFRLSRTGALRPTIGEPDGTLGTALRTPADKRSKAQTTIVNQAHEKSDVAIKAKQDLREQTQKQIAALKKRVPKVMVMADMESPRTTHLLDRGLYTARGEEVQSATPVILPPLPNVTLTNRLTLAQWLVDPEHPLTARVTVNRFWQMLFGIGLVKTVEDFGVQAEYPIQRELLDWLAAEFVRSGWDVKALLKTIVMSETYQRSSAVESFAEMERDPDNRLLARGSRFRMPSWMIRDQALAVTGLLKPTIGGPSVYSYQPKGIWAEATFGKKTYTEATGDDLYRRSLYTYWRRIVGPSMFFDNAKRQICEVKPLRTNTPMHALNTLNNVTFVEAARHLATSLLNEHETREARFAGLGKRVLGREATSAEQAVWQRSLERAQGAFEKDPAVAKDFLSHGNMPADDSLAAPTLAAWTALCLNVLNLDETLTKE